MPYSVEGKLVVAISSRALFDFEEENEDENEKEEEEIRLKDDSGRPTHEGVP